MREILLNTSTPLIIIILLLMIPSCSDITNISTEQLKEQSYMLEGPGSNIINKEYRLLYILNDEIISSRFIKRIKPVYIDSIFVHREDDAVQLYGEDGKYGAVEIIADDKIFTDLKPDTTKN